MAAASHASTVAAKSDHSRGRTFSWGLAAAIVAFSAVVATFYGASHYKAATGHAVQLSAARAQQFQVVFRELLKARFNALGLGADALLQSREVVDAFVTRDRQALGAKVDPFFAYLNRRHDVVQMNFWLQPATMFYRAGASEMGEYDASRFRKSIVAAAERHDRIMAVEMGQGGVVGVRAVVPVFQAGQFKGLIELVGSFHEPLAGASRESGFRWALGVNKDRLNQVERAGVEDLDAPRQDDVFIDYADKETGDIIRSLPFNPRGKDLQVIEWQDRHFVVDTIAVPNYAGAATITVALVEEITGAHASAFKASVIRGVALFSVLALALLLAWYKLDHFRAALLGSLGAEKKLLRERLVRGDAAIRKLDELEAVRRQNFYRLMVAINQPLLAMSGQVSAVLARTEKENTPLDDELRGRIRFIAGESRRLQEYVGDFLQVELFRQGMAGAEQGRVVLREVLEKAVANLDYCRQLPRLKLDVDLPAQALITHGNPAMLERAFTNLLGYAIFSNGQGHILVAGRQDAQTGLRISITGSALLGDMAPTPALLDEINLLVQDLEAGMKTGRVSEKIMGLFLARIIFENSGGQLGVTASGEPGFVVNLPEVK